MSKIKMVLFSFRRVGFLISTISLGVRKMNITLQNWLSSDYSCDKQLKSSQDTQKRIELEKTSIKIGLLDIPSQLIKLVIETLLWAPVVVCLTMIGVKI